MTPSLADFVSSHRLRKPKPDSCGDPHVIGQWGDIYEYGPGLLAATIVNAPSHYWAQIRRLVKHAGCVVIQDGDIEGSFIFDPSNLKQARLAIRAISAFPKKKVSNQLHVRFRKTCTGKGGNASRNVFRPSGEVNPHPAHQTQFLDPKI
jgi:hypothetical protein